MFAHSSLKTSFSTKKAGLAAQYHIQKQDLTRCFFFSKSLSRWLAITEEKKNVEFFFLFLLNRILTIMAQIFTPRRFKKKLKTSTFFFFGYRKPSGWRL
jgi:hypothetical protein